MENIELKQSIKIFLENWDNSFFELDRLYRNVEFSRKEDEKDFKNFLEFYDEALQARQRLVQRYFEKLQ